MRFALNETLVSYKETRRAYASVIGFYFSPHGAAVRRRNAGKKKVVRQKKKAKSETTECVTELSGQIAWKI